MFRATWTKLAIAGMNQSPKRAALRQAVGEGLLTRVRANSVVDWLPLDVHISVADATVTVLGVAGARAFWKERLLAAFKTRTMAPFVAGASFVFGEQPYALMKIAMSAYKLMARNAGYLSVSSGGKGFVLVDFLEMPALLVESKGWHAICHGQCEAVFHYLDMPGEITLSDVSASSFRYTMKCGSAG